ncbi:MAG: 50S ribosomal protein L9 [Bacteroidales bacterium]|nr:50S ribosomal protein L9 [Bacteroidales bacterium]
MEIILTQNVANLGAKDTIIKVKDGYARNYLIPQGLAVMATSSAKKVLAENARQRAHKEARIKEEALALAQKMEGTMLRIGAKTSSTGKIFGSINAIQIAEALQEQGFEVDRRNIALDNNQVKEVGQYKAKVFLHKDVSLDIDFEVFSE